MAKQWEYKCTTIGNDPNGTETTLDRLGANGWELVHITAYGMMILKRPVDNPDE